MPKLPRDVTQEEVIRALRRAGGIELVNRGKGSHRNLRMPNGQVLTIPYHIRPGLLNSCIKQAGLSVEEFLDLL